MQTTQNIFESPFDAWVQLLNSSNWSDDRNYYQTTRNAFLEAWRLGVSQPEAFFVVANQLHQAGKTVVWPKLHNLWLSARREWKALRAGHGVKPPPSARPVIGDGSQQPINGIGSVASTPRAVASKTVIIDGTNVIYGSHSNPQPSLMNVLGLLLELQQRAHAFKCFFDAGTFYSLLKAGEKAEAACYRQLGHDFPDLFIEIPGGNKADDFLLQYVNAHGGSIISNDLFRDYLEKYHWLKTDPKRRVSFVKHSNMMQFATLGFTAAIPSDLAVAEKALRTGLGKPAAGQVTH